MSFPVRRPFRASWLAAAIALAVGAPALAAPSNDAGVDRFVVRFKPGTVEHGNAKARQRMLDAVGHEQHIGIGLARRGALGVDVIRTDHKLDADEVRALRKRLLADPRVEYVVADRRMHRALTPNDTHYATQWHYFQATGGMRADVAWNTATGSGVVVAVLDTGITSHSDLTPNVLAGYDFITDATTANDGGGRDGDASDPGDWNNDTECDSPEGDVGADDSSWHGTHTAGTVGAVTNNAKGVAGVAFGAKVQAVRVLGKCGGSSVDIAEAIVWAAGGSVPGVPANPTPAEVLNLSLGGGGSCDPYTQDAINTAVGLGAVVVVAAGNDGEDAAFHSPASCDNVITVGSNNSNGTRSTFSNYGAKLDLMAPGEGIHSTFNTGATSPSTESYAYNQGTSMSAPHVAGTVALMQSVKVQTPAMVERILRGTARSMAGPCPLGCGKGMLTADAAVSAAGQSLLYIDDPQDFLEGNAGTSTLTYTVRLSEALGTDVTFDIATGPGSATAGTDYVAASATAQVIPAGQTSKTFNVTVNGDTTEEANETLFVNVTNVVGVMPIDTQAVAKLMNDENVVVLAKGVPVTGLARPTGDYDLYTIDVPAGATNLTITTTGTSGDLDLYVRRGVPPTESTFDCASGGETTDELCVIDEPAAGTWYVMAHSFDAYAGVSLTADYTPMPSGTLSIGNVSVAEGNAGTKLATFTVTLSAASPAPVTFSVATANGTATAGSDYTAVNLTGQTIPAGTTSKLVNVTLSGDTAIEANETFTVNLSSVVGAGVSDGSATGTIVNDDFPGISIGDVAVTEGNAGTRLATFTATLSTASVSPVTFNVATANGTATAGTDYTAVSLTGQSIPAGTTSKLINVTVSGDAATETNETFAVNLSAVAGATVTDGNATGTIINDDGPTLSVVDASIAEGNSGTKVLAVTVKLSQAAATAVTYNLTTANGTATAGTDYVAASLTGLSIPAGSTTATHNITLNGDATVEANETILVNVTNVAGGASLLDGQGVATILNDDGPVITIADVSVGEGSGGAKSMVFTVRLSYKATVPVTYSIATVANSAKAGTDFTHTALTGQTIPAGVLTKTFSVPLVTDTVVEPNELFVVLLTNATGATLMRDRALGYVLNDDGPTISIADVTTIEGHSGTKLATYTVKLSSAATVPVTYNIATANGTALAGSDYVASALVGQSIPAGQLTKTFTVTINGDTSVETNDTYFVNLSAVTGATVFDGQAMGTIINDEGPRLTIGDVAVTEGNSGGKLITFTISLSEAALVPVKYNITTINVDAVAPADFTARTLFGETIAAGMLSKTFNVVVNGDTTIEPNEKFYVAMSSSTGASIYDNAAIGTITNDD